MAVIHSVTRRLTESLTLFFIHAVHFMIDMAWHSCRAKGMVVVVRGDDEGIGEKVDTQLSS